MSSRIFEMNSTISRSEQLRLPLLDRKRDVLRRAKRQASDACQQFLGRVDIDRFRNPIKNLLGWLQPTPEDLVAERLSIARDEGWFAMIGCKLTHPFRTTLLFPREALLFSMLLLGACTYTVKNTDVQTLLPWPTDVAATHTSALPEAEVAAVDLPLPNWLSGTPELKGSKAAVLGAFEYAKKAGYMFALNEAERDRLVAEGTLVKLEGPYLELVDVSSPYVLPVTNQFVNRLAQQYAERGCGTLKVTGGMRPLDFQGTLSNGSDNSVHPTGMAVDLQRVVPTDEAQAFCLSWLQGTLMEIEADRRIDVTAEDYPRHFHVVVVQDVYAAWLKLQKGLDPDVKWLATALYFEAAFNESMEGYRAIGWAIRNRVRSGEYPNTILEVVAEGAAGKSAGGCQFSFMCDGKAERIQTLCAQPNSIMTQYWLGKCDERWEVVVTIAKQILAETDDPTGGAVLYYAASMDKKPDWAASDMKRGTIRKVGSHVFACSKWRGSDACRQGDRS